jgi:ABC-type phosphate transport system substrate-binding protein
MIDIKKPVVLGVVASLALGIFAAVPAAHADPVSGSYVAVGSDTLDSSMNGLTNGTATTGSDVRITAGTATLGSFDAFGSATIQTTSEGPYFTRPSGSGAGVDALIASIKGTALGATYLGVDITGQVDIARSSSGPGANANANGKIVYVPYARDAVAYMYIPDPAHPTDLANQRLHDHRLHGRHPADSPACLGHPQVLPERHRRLDRCHVHTGGLHHQHAP